MKHLGKLGADAPVILMYHRVAAPLADPWGLCVSPDRFRDQMAGLKARRTVMPMDALVDSLLRGDVPARAVAITFDDGYADNALVAAPILEEMEIPATLFVTTGFVGNCEPFWWDELAQLVLLGSDAADFDIELDGVRLNAKWKDQTEVPADLAAWRIDHRSADPRRAAYRQLWEALQKMEPAVRSFAMAKLRSTIGHTDACLNDKDGASISRNMAREMMSRTFTLGAHASSHTPLTRLPAVDREAEITGSRVDVAALAETGEVTGFAYPHGDWDMDTRELVIKAGFRWAVTTQESAIDTDAFDRFALPRLAVRDWSGDALLRTISHYGA